jgi:hypothetical protein
MLMGLLHTMTLVVLPVVVWSSLRIRAALVEPNSAKQPPRRTRATKNSIDGSRLWFGSSSDWHFS